MGLTKVDLKGLDDGTDGQIITYDANGNPVAVGPGDDGQVLTSTGAGSPPAFEDASGTTINNNADNRIITGSGTAGTLNGESGLTFDGSKLDVTSPSTAANDSEPIAVFTTQGHCQVRLDGDGNKWSLVSLDSADAGDHFIIYDKNNSAERLRIKSTGELLQYGYFGLAANVSADDLVIGNADSGVNRGMTIFSNSSQSGSIGFADSDANYQGAIQYLHASDTFRLLTAANERARISSEGIVSTCSINHGLTVSTTQDAGTSKYLYRGSHSGTEGNSGSGNIVFNVWSNGNVESATNSYGSTSDVKLKENIVDANSQWNDIKTIKIRNYNFKAETGNPTHTQIGLIAQELETVCPKLVYETPDLNEKGEDLETTTKAINYSVLYIKAIKALQEAMVKIETLETKVAALEAG